MRKRSRAAAWPPRPAAPREVRTTKAERRAAKTIVIQQRRWRRAVERTILGDYYEVASPRFGIAAIARRMRPRPPSRLWMRGNMVPGASPGHFTLHADPAGSTEVTVYGGAAEAPGPSWWQVRSTGERGPYTGADVDQAWSAYDQSDAGRRSLTSAYRSLVTGTPVRFTPLDEYGRQGASDHNPVIADGRPGAWDVTMTLDMADVDPETFTTLFNLQKGNDSE